MSLEHTTLEIQIKAKKVIRDVQVCKYAEIEQATVQRDCFLNQKWIPFEEWLNLNKQIKELEAENQQLNRDKEVMQKGIDEYLKRIESLGTAVLAQQKLIGSLKVSDELLGKANDEIQLLKEGNYDLLYTNAFLQEDKTDLENKIADALKIINGKDSRLIMDLDLFLRVREVLQK